MLERVIKNLPRGVWHHAAFIVDNTSLEADVVSYGDDNGSWTGHCKPKRKYCVQIDADTHGTSTIQEFQNKLEEIKGLENNIFTLCHNYFRHGHIPEFRKMIVIVRDFSGNVLSLTPIQYYFEGGVEVPVKLPKYGNTKDKNDPPYMCTSRPVLQKLKKKIGRNLPKGCRTMLSRGWRDLRY